MLWWSRNRRTVSTRRPDPRLLVASEPSQQTPLGAALLRGPDVAKPLYDALLGNLDQQVLLRVEANIALLEAIS